MNFLFDGGDCCLPIVIPHNLYNDAKAVPNNPDEEAKGSIRCVAADETTDAGDIIAKVRPTILGIEFLALRQLRSDQLRLGLL